MKSTYFFLILLLIFSSSYTRLGMTWLADPFKNIKRIQQEQEELFQEMTVKGFTDNSQSITCQFNAEERELQIGLPENITEQNISTQIRNGKAVILIEAEGLACSIEITKKTYKIDAEMKHKDESSSSKSSTSYFSTLQYPVDLDNIDIVLDKEETNVISIILPQSKIPELQEKEIRIRLKNNA